MKSCFINGKQKTCMIDLASECTVMRKKFAKKLNLHINKTDTALIGSSNSVTIVKNHELGYDVIVSHDILSNSGLQASMNESSLTFSESPNLLNLSEDRPAYRVNLINSKDSSR